MPFCPEVSLRSTTRLFIRCATRPPDDVRARRPSLHGGWRGERGLVSYGAMWGNQGNMVLKGGRCIDETIIENCFNVVNFFEITML